MNLQPLDGIRNNLPRRPADEPGATSDAGWFQDVIVRIVAARKAGDSAEVERLRDYARREGDEGLAQMVDQLLTAADDAQAAARAGRPMARRSIGANLPGRQRLCDFCASTQTAACTPAPPRRARCGASGTCAGTPRQHQSA